MTTFITSLPTSSTQSCVARQNLSLVQDNATLPAGGTIKNYQGNLTLSSASQTVQLQIPSGFTYTLPNVSGNLVGRTGTTTVTNKTIIGGSSGNNVNITALNGATISGTPATGNIFQASSGSAAGWASYTPLNVYSCRVMPKNREEIVAGGANQNITGNATNDSILYPGSSVVGIVGFAAYITTSDTGGGNPATVALRDVTNSLDIATLTANLSGANYYSTTSISNVPSGVAQLRILANRNNTVNVTVQAYIINFG
jgi:hypothetical protein